MAIKTKKFYKKSLKNVEVPKMSFSFPHKNSENTLCYDHTDDCSHHSHQASFDLALSALSLWEKLQNITVYKTTERQVF